jgi:carbonic anhydrase
MKSTLKRLLDGYKNFRGRYHPARDPLMRNLARQGQHPQTMVITCCDSRIDPAILFQCQPGDLFVVRNIANIVPPHPHDHGHHSTSAALEFGVNYLNIKHLVVLGHSHCGGVQAALGHTTLHQDDFLTPWMELISVGDADKSDVDACARASLVNAYNNCLTYPWIVERLEEGTLQIHLWFFDIASCTIIEYDRRSGEFTSLI